jgi:hypothetical protein
MKFFGRRKGDGIFPDGMEDVQDFAKLPIGKLLSIEIRTSRSNNQLRLWWGLCRRIGESVGAEAESVSDLLLIESGHCETLRSKKYGDILRAKSIAFTAMDQTEFNQLFDKAVDVIVSNWGIARKDVLEAVQDLLIPTEAR